MGPTHLNAFMAELNMPGIHHKSLRAREKEVAVAVEAVVKKSCDRALQQEIELSKAKGGDGLTVSADAGWSKRSSGRNYNSDTGHAALIGEQTDKCVAYSFRTRRCRCCDAGQTDQEHKCSKNWTGSSKAMEPDMVVTMLHSVEDRGGHVSTLVMDNDATTLARAKQHFPHLKKRPDKNHSVKLIRNRLYDLRNKHPPLKSEKTFLYVQKLLKIAICQHQDNSSGLTKRLGEIVPHMYGEHENCSQEWYCMPNLTSCSIPMF